MGIARAEKFRAGLQTGCTAGRDCDDMDGACGWNKPYHAIASAVATGGLGLGDGREARHRQSVLRLKAVASSTNSALTFDRPRSKNRRPAICSLRMPNTGSFNPLRRSYKRCACSVAIHWRCLRINVSTGPIHSARPACLSFVQTPKAGQARHTALGARYRRNGPDILPFAFLIPRKGNRWPSGHT